jgi:hypothetical protein
VYRNEGNAHHWIKVRLEGTVSNRDAIGAAVRIVAGDLIQYRVQTGGVNDMSQSSTDIHFGLGTATQVDTLEVNWPSGHKHVLCNLPVDETHVIVESSTAATADDSRRPGVLLRRSDPQLVCGTVRFDYHLPYTAAPVLDIYDLAGRHLRHLEAGRQPPGWHTVFWDGCSTSGTIVPTGVYFARLRSGAGTHGCRITVLY